MCACVCVCVCVCCVCVRVFVCVCVCVCVCFVCVCARVYCQWCGGRGGIPVPQMSQFSLDVTGTLLIFGTVCALKA